MVHAVIFGRMRRDAGAPVPWGRRIESREDSGGSWSQQGDNQLGDGP